MMCKTDRQKKIIELLRKNKVNHLIYCLKKYFKNLSEKDFLSVDETISLEKKVFENMDILDTCNKSQKYPLSYDYSQWIKKYIKAFDYTQDVILFFIWEQKTYAIKVILEEVIENVDYVISISSIANNGPSFIITKLNLEIGLCVWSTEYEIITYFW